MEKLPQDFRSFLKLLSAHDARHLVVGGYAVAVHGFSRYTGDIDVWIDATEENALKIVNALQEFGFEESELDSAVFTTPDQIIRFGAEPTRIEILTGISGVEFNKCFTNRVIQKIDGLDVPFLSLHDLRANKQAAGRPKDLLDLDNLPE